MTALSGRRPPGRAKRSAGVLLPSTARNQTVWFHITASPSVRATDRLPPLAASLSATPAAGQVGGSSPDGGRSMAAHRQAAACMQQGPGQMQAGTPCLQCGIAWPIVPGRVRAGCGSQARMPRPPSLLLEAHEADQAPLAHRGRRPVAGPPVAPARLLCRRAPFCLAASAACACCRSRRMPQAQPGMLPPAAGMPGWACGWLARRWQRWRWRRLGGVWQRARCSRARSAAGW